MTLSTTERILEIADQNIQTARGIKEGGNEIAPVYFIITEEGGNIEALAFLQPEAVMHIHEAWTVISHGGNHDETIAAQVWVSAGNRLADYPGAGEAIMGNIDGRGINRLYIIPIKDGKLGETDVQDNVVAGGRMTNLSGHLGQN